MGKSITQPESSANQVCEQKAPADQLDPFAAENCYRPVNRGGRFSRKARVPSL
jgi:hypothetical protein